MMITVMMILCALISCLGVSNEYANAYNLLTTIDINDMIINEYIKRTLYTFSQFHIVSSCQTREK